MKFSLKKLAAVAVLAAAATGANAAINNGSTGDGGLYFGAWDGASSFTFDLGIQINAFETSLGQAGALNLNWGATEGFLPAYSGWLAAANTAQLQWSVLATDTVGQNRILTTVGAATLPALNSNADVLRIGAGNLQTYLNAVNPVLTANSSLFVVTSDPSASTYAGRWGDKINNKFNFDTTADFTNSSYANGVAFQKTLAAGTGFNKGTNNAYFDEGTAVKAWVDGEGLHIAAIPAVPEPSETAMLLAGLGLIGFAARRKAHRA